MPRYFSIAQREQILRNGLGDRDETVRASAAKLIGQWVDRFNGNLLEYLDTFELVSGTEVAEDALKALFKHRPGVLDSMKFEGAHMLVGSCCLLSHMECRLVLDGTPHTGKGIPRSRLCGSLRSY